MKKWRLILGVVLAVLILAVTPLAVMAAGNNAGGLAARLAGKTQLAIVQPRVAVAGQAMQLTVLERRHQTAVGAAEVWAVSQANIPNVKEAIQALNTAGTDNATVQDYLDILAANGSRLGQTDAAGKLTCTFDQAANLWLVAFKTGYRPGISHLAVRNTISISAVKKAVPGEVVTITVKQKETSEVVSGAAVWAVDAANAKALREKLGELIKANRKDLAAVDWNAALAGLATQLGTTDVNGQVTYSFTQGKYLLAAVKKGCLPAYAGITIAEAQPAPSQTVN